MRKRKACVQCTNAKRRCDKSAPRCRRCVERGDACRYESFRHLSHDPSDTSGFAAGGGDAVARPSADNHTAYYTDDGVEPSPTSPGHGATAQPVAASTSGASGPASGPASDNIPSELWFLSPDSWQRRFNFQRDEPLNNSVCEETLPHYIAKLQSWMHNWVTDGHCPLMHRHLYRGQMPDCVQDAFTALAAYHVARTPAARATALRIINRRADALVLSQPSLDVGPDYVTRAGRGVDGNMSSCSSSILVEPALPTTSVILDTLTHLARTQALFVYQLVRLFDGDIRSRALAEAHADTLHAWYVSSKTAQFPKMQSRRGRENEF